MATKEGTRASAEFMCICLAPDVCKSPTIPVPYKILSLFDCAVNFSANVRFRTRFVFHHNSRLSTVRCDEAGVGGGVLSGVNMGFCRPIPGTHSKTVRVNGSFVDYHVGTYMFMNCAGPEGPFNTIGQVIFLGNMLPGPVSPSGKVPKGCICGNSGILSDVQSSIGDVEGLIAKGKKLYELAQTDWSDPSSVLGAIGGIAGIAGLQDVAHTAKTAKDLYDKGKNILKTDWSDPKQALAAVAGISNVAGMDGIAQAADMASKIRDVIKTDWSDPKAAVAAATNIMKSSGLNHVAAGLASDAILSSDLSGSSTGLPQCFPAQGAKQQSADSTGSNLADTFSNTNSLPPSNDGKPRRAITQDVLDEMQTNNPTAYERYMALEECDRSRAFVEIGKPGTDKDGYPISESHRTAVYIPGQGFSPSPQERADSILPAVPAWLKEVFVAEKDGDKENFVGIKQKKGNWYLFGGIVDLGSPEMPGAGDANAWWIPDNLFGLDMSGYYDYHDKNYYGSDVRISDMGSILGTELKSLVAGIVSNPLTLPIQAIYSTATTLVGTLTAGKNTLSDIDGVLGDVIGKGDFSSFKEFLGTVFGDSSVTANDLGNLGIVPGGCMGPGTSPFPGQSPTGAGGGAPGSGTAPTSGTAGAPDGSASGAGTDGVLITTAPGSPAAIAAAIEAQFRAENQVQLEKTQAEERARQVEAAKQKVEKEKSNREKAVREKSETEQADEEKTGPVQQASETDATFQSASGDALQSKVPEKDGSKENDRSTAGRLTEAVSKDAEDVRTDYATDKPAPTKYDESGRSFEGSNKCNLYVYDKLKEAGIEVPLVDRESGIRARLMGEPQFYKSPPLAREWNDKGFKIDGFETISDVPLSDMASKVRPGDVVTNGTHMVIISDKQGSDGNWLAVGAAQSEVHANDFGVTSAHGQSDTFTIRRPTN